MSYSSIKSEINSRFNEVNFLLNRVKSIEDSIIPPASPPVEYKIIKGLCYVQLYACIEFAVNKTILTTLTLIKSKNVTHHHFSSKFNTIALSSNLHSIRDCNSKVFLEKSADLFLTLESLDVANFDETYLLKYIQNIWGKTFNQLTKSMGVSPFVISPRSITVFDEIVDNRNKLAHGRESAENIGSSPKFLDLKTKYDTVYEVITLYVEHFEAFYSSKEFIVLSERANY